MCGNLFKTKAIEKITKDFEKLIIFDTKNINLSSEQKKSIKNIKKATRDIPNNKFKQFKKVHIFILSEIIGKLFCLEDFISFVNYLFFIIYINIFLY